MSIWKHRAGEWKSNGERPPPPPPLMNNALNDQVTLKLVEISLTTSYRCYLNRCYCFAKIWKSDCSKIAKIWLLKFLMLNVDVSRSVFNRFQQFLISNSKYRYAVSKIEEILKVEPKVTETNSMWKHIFLTISAVENPKMAFSPTLHLLLEYQRKWEKVGCPSKTLMWQSKHISLPCLFFDFGCRDIA